MAEYGTSQRVVERALKPLVEAGVVRARRGAGLRVVEAPTPEPAAHYATDCLILYRSSESRLAQSVLLELQQRLRASGLHVTLMSFDDEPSAIERLERQGRARCCLVQINFEIVSIAFLACVRAHADALVIDGISVTGIDADVIGTNWREALSIAYRSLVEKGHRRIAFLTSSHGARQVAMARREFLLLSGCRDAPDHPLLFQVDALPGSYPRAAIERALPITKGAKKRTEDYTALIVWGLVDGSLLDGPLIERGLRLGVDLSVMLLGSIDVPSEHLERFDVIGNSHVEKLDLFERIVRSRIAGDPAPPRTHYLPIHFVENGSVLSF